MKNARPIDHAEYDQLVAEGRRLKYEWHRRNDSHYALMRPDGSTVIEFGPVHPSDVEYFNKLCKETSEANPYDPTKPIKYKVIGYWSGLVFLDGKVFDDSGEAWAEAEKLNLEISADSIVVIDDGLGTERMEKFYYVERPGNQ